MFILKKKTKRKTKPFIYPCIGGILISTMFTFPAGAAENHLFSSASHRFKSTIKASVDPTVMREKVITITTNLLQPSSRTRTINPNINTLTFDFFGKSSVAIFDRSENVGKEHTSWIGHLQNNPDSLVILTQGKDGIMQGNITDGYKKYHLRYIKHVKGKAIHSFQQIDQTKFPQDHPDGFEIGGVLPDKHESHSSDAASKTSAETLIAQADTDVVDSGALIDVMVLYTAATAAEVGGVASMDTKIALAITETNIGYAASGIAQRMNLVHAQQIVYTQTGDMLADLKNLANTGDAANPIVIAPTLRDTHKADLVSLFVTDAGYGGCGLGYVGPGATAAFQITAQNCATGNYSFAHEFGHNQGTLHNRENASGAFNGDGKYQYGYRNTAEGWRTIMAYNDSVNCPELPSPPYSSGQHHCFRKNFWSNPNKSFNGDPTGIDSSASNAADNSKFMNDNAYIVTNNRFNHTDYDIPDNQWHQISVPYAPPFAANTVADVFSALVATGTINTDWAIYKYDGTGYTTLGASDTVMQGVGYWVIQKSGNTVTISIPAASLQTPVPVTSPKCPSSSGCFETATLTTSGTSVTWNMMGNPFPQNKQVKGIVIDSTHTDCTSTNGCSFDSAVTESQVSGTIYHYNSSNGSYDSLTSTSYLGPWAGFWLAILTDADGTSPKLLFPSNVQR